MHNRGTTLPFTLVSGVSGFYSFVTKTSGPAEEVTQHRQQVPPKIYIFFCHRMVLLLVNMCFFTVNVNEIFLLIVTPMAYNSNLSMCSNSKLNTFNLINQ